MRTLIFIAFIVRLINAQSIQYPEIPWTKENENGFACNIPDTMQGKWYVDDNGVGTEITINSNSMDQLGECIRMRYDDSYSVYRNTFLFLTRFVYPLCIVQEISLNTKNWIVLIQPIHFNQWDSYVQLWMNSGFITMFAVTPRPVNCRPSIEGVYTFNYRYGKTMGYCNSRANHVNRIVACQKPGTNFANENERFFMNYSRCDRVQDRIEDDPYATSNKQGKDQYDNAHITYSCLGQWELANGNLYFAVANLGEAQKHLKYRCFMTRRDQPFYMVKSKSASCSELRHARDGPEQLILTPMEFARVTPTCHFPKDFIGSWVNTANYDSKVIINSTHLYEENLQNQRLVRKTFYVCKESQGSRYLTTRLSYSGCQVDHVCWDFQSNQQNVIRYRSSLAALDGKFGQVCPWSNFLVTHSRWKYSTLLALNPTPIPCPIQGRYLFVQNGQVPLIDRIIGEVTSNPQVQVDCNRVEAELQVCSTNNKVINVDVARCASLDALGKPMGEFDRFDYRMSCIGYWKEDTLSHLITYDENDPSSKYRCWVYQRTQIGTIIMSRSIQSYCGVDQLAGSWNASQGANLNLKLIESERQFDHCPMYFNPGDLDSTDVSEREIILLNSSTLPVAAILKLEAIFIFAIFYVTLHL